jgi:hypothetical protein
MSGSDWQLVLWSLPKFGHAAEEFEDAFAAEPTAGRFAAADGATESSFANRWARALAQAFARQPPPWPPDSEALAAWLAPLQAEWHAGVPWEGLPWYALEKARSGAFATLLGLEFFPDATGDPGGTWRGTAVGDSVLFLIREGELRLSWPVPASDRLGNRPRLLCSLPAYNALAVRECQTIGGEARPGDRFLLMTDSPAKWFLTAVEAGGRPWEELLALPAAAAFEAWVTEMRRTRVMRNDDVTVAALVVPETVPRPPEQLALPPAPSP